MVNKVGIRTILGKRPVIDKEHVPVASEAATRPRGGKGAACVDTVPGAAPPALLAAATAGASSGSLTSYSEYGDEARYGVMRSAKGTQTYWLAGCRCAGGAAGGGAPLARRGTPPTTPLPPHAAAPTHLAITSTGTRRVRVRHNSQTNRKYQC